MLYLADLLGWVVSELIQVVQSFTGCVHKQPGQQGMYHTGYTPTNHTGTDVQCSAEMLPVGMIDAVGMLGEGIVQRNSLTPVMR